MKPPEQLDDRDTAEPAAGDEEGGGEPERETDLDSRVEGAADIPFPEREIKSRSDEPDLEREDESDRSRESEPEREPEGESEPEPARERGREYGGAEEEEREPARRREGVAEDRDRPRGYRRESRASSEPTRYQRPPVSSREPRREFRPAEPAAVKGAIDDVNRIIETLRSTLDDMEELLETLELAERQKDADEQEIESLRRSLRNLHRPR